MSSIHAGAELQVILHVLAIGVGATILLDLWSASLKLFFHIPSTNWAMVGRWLGHELILGWSLHYAIGIGFASILITLFGFDWLRQPTIVPALVVGVFTVVFPFFLLQPGMGLGIAATNEPHDSG